MNHTQKGTKRSLLGYKPNPIFAIVINLNIAKCKIQSYFKM